MTNNNRPLDGKVVLITGAAHRIGATTARILHAAGMNVVIHYRSSRDASKLLQSELTRHREDSVVLIQADLHHTQKLKPVIREAINSWGRLDALVNNASSFYPTPLSTANEEQWNDLIGSNLKAPFFLCQAAADALRQTRGCIVNIVDIHHERPLKNHAIYSIAKAGLAMLTKAMARELGPEIRVNGVSPGAILWPENDMDDVTKQRIISRTVLKRQGEPADIANAVKFLIAEANYMSGQILAVDGGRTLSN